MWLISAQSFRYVYDVVYQPHLARSKVGPSIAWVILVLPVIDAIDFLFHRCTSRAGTRMTFSSMKRLAWIPPFSEMRNMNTWGVGRQNVRQCFLNITWRREWAKTWRHRKQGQSEATSCVTVHLHQLLSTYLSLSKLIFETRICPRSNE
jgi:hypothetical protein